MCENGYSSGANKQTFFCLSLIMGIEYHYAPMTGGLAVKVDGEFKPVDNP